MQKISSLLSANRIFFTGYVLFLAASLCFLALTEKVQGFLLLNSFHTPLLDLFFVWYTNVGDGLFSIGIFLFLLWRKKPTPAWEIVFAFLLSGLLVQVLKNFFPMPRPKTLMADMHYDHFIQGITHIGHASFPSGHTATAFGTAAILSFFSSDKKTSVLFFTAALLVAFSRIYLGQHFLQDVLAGSLIGVPVAVSIYLIFDKNPQWIEKLRITLHKKNRPQH